MNIIFLLSLFLVGNAYSDQENCQDKGPIACKDGVSFDQVKQEVRELDPNIPEIIIDQGLDGFGLGDNYAGYSYPHHKILVHPKTLAACDSNSIQWILLHESGHSQYPKFCSYKILGSALIALTAMYSVSLPVKSMAIKLASKYLISKCIFVALMNGIQNLEERRADAWANKCAEKQAINAQIKLFARIDKNQQKEWSQDGRSSYIPYSVGQYFLDSDHPSIVSRIKACEHALQKRFGTKN